MRSPRPRTGRRGSRAPDEATTGRGASRFGHSCARRGPPRTSGRGMISGMDPWLLWLIAAGLFAAGEIASLDLVLLMFAGGALGGMVVALLGGAVAIQLVAFVAGGGGRPFFVPPVAPGAPGGGAAPPPGGGGPRGGAP